MYIFIVAVVVFGNSLLQERLIDRAAFISGCWRLRTANRVIDEQWMRPRGGTMMGMSRTVRGDSLMEYEFVRIFERGTKLIFAAQPSGQTPSEFPSALMADRTLIFENSAHDFPQRILYRAAGDSLIARIEGTINGSVRGFDFRYARVSCD